MVHQQQPQYWTFERHRARHVELQAALDELAADWIAHTSGLPSKCSVLELMQWACGQAVCPMPDRNGTGHAGEKVVEQTAHYILLMVERPKIIPSRPQATEQPAIRCRVCGLTSFNPNDIEQKYCGNCHAFHPRATAQE